MNIDFEKTIDLRSDTVTRPSEGMLRAMASAPTGDDVYGEDPTINELQNRVAEMLGKEAALFVPSGTMGNQIAIKAWTNPGDEIIIEADAHVFYYETGGLAFNSGVQVNTVKSLNGEMDLDEIEEKIRPNIYYLPTTKVISLENTHNRHGGAILSLDYIRKCGDLAKKHDIKFHLDGARLWNASAETGISLADYAEPFDSVSVCLSKGLGAPVGSVLVGGKELIEKAWKIRKILGGGMRQAGVLAAAGLYALDNNFPKMKQDHDRARAFAEGLAQSGSVSVAPERVQTNMVVFGIPLDLPVNEFIERCKSKGVLLGGVGKNFIRAVFHLHITNEDARKAVEVVLSCV